MSSEPYTDPFQRFRDAERARKREVFAAKRGFATGAVLALAGVGAVSHLPPLFPLPPPAPAASPFVATPTAAALRCDDAGEPEAEAGFLPVLREILAITRAIEAVRDGMPPPPPPRRDLVITPRNLESFR